MKNQRHRIGNPGRLDNLCHVGMLAQFLGRRDVAFERVWRGSVPEEELLRECLGFGPFGGFPVKDVATGPLCASNKKDTDFALWRNDGFNPLDMGMLSGEGDAGADVDGELEHLEAVVEEVFPEGGCGFTLVLLFHGEVEADK